jgi:hypothetical protein
MSELVTQPDLIIKGRARRDDDAELLLLLLLLMGDVVEATALWARLAPAGYRSMLRGGSPGGAPGGSAGGWAYTSDAMQWSRQVQPVDPVAVKGAIIAFVLAAEDQARSTTALLTSGRLDLSEWQGQMVDLVKRVQVGVAAVARGGTARLPASELATTSTNIPPDPTAVSSTGDLVLYQADRLQRFAQQIEMRHPSADTAEKIENRAALYPRTAVTQYEHVRQREAIAVGITEELNVLGVAEHCYSTQDELVLGCKNCTDAGWQPVGTLPMPGLRKCRVNCRCSMLYRRDGEIIGQTP